MGAARTKVPEYLPANLRRALEEVRERCSAATYRVLESLAVASCDDGLAQDRAQARRTIGKRWKDDERLERQFEVLAMARKEARPGEKDAALWERFDGLCAKQKPPLESVKFRAFQDILREERHHAEWMSLFETERKSRSNHARLTDVEKRLIGAGIPPSRWRLTQRLK